MNALIKRTDRFTEADIDSEIVIMRLDNGETYSMSGTAAEIWRLIDGTRDKAALIAALSGKFPADKRQGAADVDEFIARLKETGLLAGG